MNWFAGGLVLLLCAQTVLADDVESVAAAPAAEAVDSAPVNPMPSLNENDGAAQNPDALYVPEDRRDSQKQALAEYRPKADQPREIARHRRHHRRHRRHRRRHHR
jgi:hypothetical protein